MIDADAIGEALQQMTGFKIGKWDDVAELVSSMGLSEEEWAHIKSEEHSGGLDEKDIAEIDKYFSEITALTENSEEGK